MLIKNREIQVITCMIMLTRSSERIFNQMRYTGFRIIHGKLNINNIRNRQDKEAGFNFHKTYIYIYISS